MTHIQPRTQAWIDHILDEQRDEFFQDSTTTSPYDVGTLSLADAAWLMEHAATHQVQLQGLDLIEDADDVMNVMDAWRIFFERDFFSTLAIEIFREGPLAVYVLAEKNTLSSVALTRVVQVHDEILLYYDMACKIDASRLLPATFAWLPLPAAAAAAAAAGINNHMRDQWAEPLCRVIASLNRATRTCHIAVYGRAWNDDEVQPATYVNGQFITREKLVPRYDTDAYVLK